MVLDTQVVVVQHVHNVLLANTRMSLEVQHVPHVPLSRPRHWGRKPSRVAFAPRVTRVQMAQRVPLAMPTPINPPRGIPHVYHAQPIQLHHLDHPHVGVHQDILVMEPHVLLALLTIGNLPLVQLHVLCVLIDHIRHLHLLHQPHVFVIRDSLDLLEDHVLILMSALSTMVDVVMESCV